MKKVFVEQIRERDFVESSFLVRDKIMAMAKNGKPYMTLKLVDRSGEVEGRVWDRVDEFAARFEKDDFIQVQGKASVYMGKMQLIVQELARQPDTEVDLADYLPVCPRDAAEMEAELRAKVAALQDVHLGGLLEHSLAVATLAEDICGRYPDIHRDLLVTGALLHDIGKVDELRYQRSFDYSDEGKLLGHIVMGVEMEEETIRTLPDFPRPLATLVKHLLLSHHGQYEYGSPKRPKTMEAVILNFLDDLDSKINGVRTHINREPENTNAWTSYHRLYDRYFFKPGPPGQEEAAAAEVPPRPAPPAREQRPPQPRPAAAEKKPGARRSFGFTLADQLQGKSLDLFAADEEKKTRHDD